MTAWMQNCTTRHTRCQRQDHNQRPTWRPARLIFVGKDNSTPLQLCKGSSLSPDVKYMTLSHRWPKESVFKLLTGNLEDLERVVPVGALPKNFCDAILLTCFLDVEYLWIDSLCIIQDSKSDWDTEAATMGDVYAHSFCNIAGTASQNVAQGLFVSRDPKALQLIEIKFQKGQGQIEVSQMVRTIASRTFGRTKWSKLRCLNEAGCSRKDASHLASYISVPVSSSRNAWS
jgi:hypothetical protein